MKKIISNRGKWEDLSLKQKNISAKGNSQNLKCDFHGQGT